MTYIWTPDLQAPLRHELTFTMWKKAVSWKRAETHTKITNSGKMARWTRNPEGQEDEQWYIVNQFTKAARREGMLDVFPWSGPVWLHVYISFKTPKDRWPGREKVSRPDVDNLAKQVMDALNPPGAGGWGAYYDDAQVVDLLASKRYDNRGDIITVRLFLFDQVAKPILRRRK